MCTEYCEDGLLSHVTMKNKYRHKFLTFNLMFLHCMGLWSFTDNIYKESWKSRIYQFYSTFMVTGFILFFLSGFIDIFFLMDDLQATSYVVSVSITNLLNFLKMIPFLFFKDKLKHLIHSFENDLFNAGEKLCSDEQIEIMNRNKRVARNVTIYVIFVAMPSIILTCFSALFSDCIVEIDATVINVSAKCIKPLPYHCWFPFETDISPNYEVALIFQIITACVDGLQACAMDGFYVGLIIYLCSQFEIVNKIFGNLEKLASQSQGEGTKMADRESDTSEVILTYFSSSDLTLNSHEPVLKYDRELNYHRKMDFILGRCISFHQSVLRVAEELRLLLNPLMLAECLGMAIIICMISFNASNLAPNTAHFLAIMLFFTIEMTLLLMYCWFGSVLMEKSKSVQHAAYETNWYNRSRSFIHSIKFVILRAQKPVTITALYFSIVSLDIFIVVMRASYSYYTLLRRLQEVEDSP